jgi:hypothetical protein
VTQSAKLARERQQTVFRIGPVEVPGSRFVDCVIFSLPQQPGDRDEARQRTSRIGAAGKAEDKDVIAGIVRIRKKLIVRRQII